MSNPEHLTTFLGMEQSYQEGEIIVFGTPYDRTTSFRPGSRFAPQAMRVDSYALETYSPYLDRDLEDYAICDAGDLKFPVGTTQRVMDLIEDYTAKIVADNKIPVMIGGEHLVSFPAIKAVRKSYPDLVVLHFDAHTDLREEFMGDKLSHATVIKRVWDLLGDNRIYQFGIRSGTKAEFEWAQEHTYLEKFSYETLAQVISEVGMRAVYITIDLDILDPAFFPGTGTLEPGGISFKELMEVINQFRRLNVVGADIVELSPHYDQSGASTAVACKVLRELILSMVE